MIPHDGGKGFDPTKAFPTLSPGTVISHYKIIEKIGAGGMGVVYKALDTRLDRAVALKFLPPHLLCDPEARTRFEHEARAASALSHANITTIHEIDEIEGHCFIVMELVEGRTVRDLAMAGGLSIGEIMGVAIQIGKGLDAAHKRGVLHRDIKSDNIMVTAESTVKIMDFGLAKLRDATKLTQAGTTMGTLPYMSPEQLRGSAVDQRSDIFSLGVVLYELIAGRLPFRGETEGAIVTAILQSTPEPLARYKAGVSQGLEQIVTKALAKDKAERYQHVDDMVADLRREARLSELAGQAVFTGPLAPATPIQTPAPSVPPGQAASVQSQPAPPQPPRSPRRLKRLWLALPVAAAAVAVVLIFVLEPFRIEMGPGKQAEAQENSLAVMYFENLADPQDNDRTAEMITALLITDLSESEYLYVISRQRLYDILSLLHKQDAKVIDRGVATEVAERAGAKWILTGSILRGERNLVLTSDVSEAATGRVVATQRISGQQGEDLFALVDRLSSAVKADLALPQKARAEPDLPVADVTTHSAEAYRYYLEGLDGIRQLYTADAEQAFLKALEYDSTFAMAYYYLAGIESGVESQRLAAKAMEYVDKVSQREKYYLRGMYAYAFGDYPNSIGILEESMKKYPDDKQLYYTLGTIKRSDLHRPREAVEAQMAAIKIDPLYAEAYNELAYDYQALGDLDSSIWAINQYIRIAPLEANPYDTRGDLYAYNGKLDEAITSYKEALRIKPDFWASMYKLGDMYLFKRDYAQAEACFKACAASSDKEERSRGRVRLALLPIYQGRLEAALGVLDDGLAADRLEQFQGTQCAWKHGLKAAIFAERLETEQSVAEARVAADLIYEAYKTPVTQMNAYYVGRLAWAGRLTEAEAAARAMREKLGPTENAQWESYWLAFSAIEMARGSPDRAAGYLRKIIGVNPDPPFHVQYLLGQACLGAGKLADAVKELEKAGVAYDDGRAIAPMSSPKLHYLLGQAYEQSGWKDKAAEQYKEFLLFWGNGDAGIPSVEDARQRLARLEAGT